MRQRQSSVTTDTQYPVRSIGATAFGLGGGAAARWPPRCAFANIGRSSNEAIKNVMGSIGGLLRQATRVVKRFQNRSGFAHKPILSPLRGCFRAASKTHA